MLHSTSLGFSFCEALQFGVCKKHGVTGGPLQVLWRRHYLSRARPRGWNRKLLQQVLPLCYLWSFFLFTKNTGWKLQQKSCECIPGSSTTRNMTIPSRFLFRQLDYVQAGGPFVFVFFFGRLRQLPWLQTNPSLFQTRVVLSFSLCVFLWLPRLPWFLISGLLHVRLTDRLCDSSIPYLQVTQPVRHSYNQMLIRSHSTKSYVNAPSRAAGGDVQQK